MTVDHLIAILQQIPPNTKVYYEAGDHKDDWREVHKAEYTVIWGQKGVYLE
jgi:hypothetical protein